MEWSEDEVHDPVFLSEISVLQILRFNILGIIDRYNIISIFFILWIEWIWQYPIFFNTQ